MTHDEIIEFYNGVIRNLPQESALVEEFNQAAEPNHRFQTGVKPCFFSGSLHPGKIVVLNLNPKYIPGGAEAEQEYALREYPNLLAFHEARFDAYKKRLETLPPTFGNMCRHICGTPDYKFLTRHHRREAFLQEAVLNLDWCYYYSENFGGEIPAGLRQKFDLVLNTVLKEVKPLFIYVIGKPFENTGWIRAYTDIDLTAPVRADLPVLNLQRSLYYGKYHDAEGTFSVPLFYLDFGAGQVSSEEAADKINAEFRARIPGFDSWLERKINQSDPIMRFLAQRAPRVA